MTQTIFEDVMDKLLTKIHCIVVRKVERRRCIGSETLGHLS